MAIKMCVEHVINFNWPCFWLLYCLLRDHSFHSGKPGQRRDKKTLPAWTEKFQKWFKEIGPTLYDSSGRSLGDKLLIIFR